jgi:hypothetical protein
LMVFFFCIFNHRAVILDKNITSCNMLSATDN